MAVAPVLVARTMERPRTVTRLGTGEAADGMALDLPYHAILLMLASRGGAFRRCDEFVAETVFIADIEGDFLIFHYQRRWLSSPFEKSGQRHIRSFYRGAR